MKKYLFFIILMVFATSLMAQRKQIVKLSSSSDSYISNVTIQKPFLNIDWTEDWTTPSEQALLMEEDANIVVSWNLSSSSPLKDQDISVYHNDKLLKSKNTLKNLGEKWYEYTCPIFLQKGKNYIWAKVRNGKQNQSSTQLQLDYVPKELMADWQGLTPQIHSSQGVKVDYGSYNVAIQVTTNKPLVLEHFYFTVNGQPYPLNTLSSRLTKTRIKNTYVFKTLINLQAGKNEVGLTIANDAKVLDLKPLNITFNKNKFSNAIAIIIGNQNYQKTPNVDYAINDALAIKDFLIHQMKFSERNVIFLQNVTKGELETYFGTEKNHKGWLYQNINADESDVFIYYSGHGAPDSENNYPYFVPVGADPDFLALSGYSLKVFYENLSKLPARSKTVLIDACFSGMAIPSATSAGITPKVKNPVLKDENTVVLTAAKNDEYACWYPEKKHGLFTWFLLDILLEPFKADKNQDRKLTFAEMHHFMEDKMRGVPSFARKQDKKQTPDIIGVNKDRVFYEY